MGTQKSTESPFRIEESELLADTHFPVKALFNMVPDCRFVDTITALSRGIGFGENYGACVFWEDLDEYDRQHTPYYAGAEFGLHNGEEVILSPEELLHYLKIVCGKYCSEHTDDTDRINKTLDDFMLYFRIG